MECTVYYRGGVARREERVPTCGVDFCESCARCLACTDDVNCMAALVDDAPHLWCVTIDADAPPASEGSRELAR